MKRLLDVILALVLVVPATFVVAVMAALVRLESRGSPIFLQTRVGHQMRPFKLVKLRTMAQDTPTGASHEIGAAAITRVGKFLRRSKIDELPQIFSVLSGSMSFVGPRPCLPIQTELIEERRKRGVFEVRPGITGRAQIMGIDMADPVRLAEIDGSYVREQSLMKDFAIMLRTLSRRAYYDAAAKKGS